MKKKQRRVNALARLERTMELGVKNTKEGEIPLSEKDIKRIGNEIATLKTRV